MIIDILAIFAIIYFIGYNITYVVLIRRYMKFHRIKSVRNTTITHENYSNKLFLHIMIFWWYYLYRNWSNK